MEITRQFILKWGDYPGWFRCARCDHINSREQKALVRELQQKSERLEVWEKRVRTTQPAVVRGSRWRGTLRVSWNRLPRNTGPRGSLPCGSKETNFANNLSKCWKLILLLSLLKECSPKFQPCDTEQSSQLSYTVPALLTRTTMT